MKVEWDQVLGALRSLGYVGDYGLFTAKEFKARWEAGAVVHGDLDLNDGRDWTKEANEELQDYYMYRAFDRLQKQFKQELAHADGNLHA